MNCKTCRDSILSESDFIYCTNPLRTITTGIQTAMEGVEIVEADDLCTEFREREYSNIGLMGSME